MNLEWLPAWEQAEGNARVARLFATAFGAGTAGGTIPAAASAHPTPPSGAANNTAGTAGGTSLVVASAPGRVNIIGEHVDYNGGLCLPMALPHRTFVALRPRGDGVVSLRSGQTEDLWSLPLAEVLPGQTPGWGAYVAGVAWALREAGYPVSGFEAAVDSCVPFGASLSSSAALTCGVAVALDRAFGLGLADSLAGRRALVKACIRAENEIAGAATGGLDQSIAMLGEPGAALALDFRPGHTDEEFARLVPFDLEAAGLALLVIDTRAPHQLNDGQYASRRAACERAAAALGVGSLRSLVDQDLDETLSRLRSALTAEAAHNEGAAPADLEAETVVRRVRHVVTEIRRTAEFIGLAERGLGAGGIPNEAACARAGALMDASHASLRDDYEVTVQETDLSVDTCRAAGAIGARMTGGGFGGSTIALVRTGDVQAVAAAVATAFAAAGLTAPGFLVATPSGPAA
ncbi:MAG: galactokinase [Promicromonosporaceae bacterium]|nr:galactokinase [Promicromonosporaceae bacterium]